MAADKVAVVFLNCTIVFYCTWPTFWALATKKIVGF